MSKIVQSCVFCLLQNVIFSALILAEANNRQRIIAPTKDTDKWEWKTPRLFGEWGMEADE
jgi:hypothetical protein